MKVKYVIIETEDGLRIADRFANIELAKQWLGKMAYNLNYGMMRQWFHRGYTYFDVGPRVFRIKGNHLPESSQ